MPYAYCDYIANKDIVSKPAITGEDEFFYIAESKIGQDEDVEEGCDPETVILLVQKEQYTQAEDLNKKTLTSCIKKMLKAAANEKKKKIDEAELKEWQKKVQDKFLDIVNNHFDEYSFYVRDADDIPDGCFIIFAKWNETADGVTFYYFKDCLYEQKF